MRTFLRWVIRVVVTLIFICVLLAVVLVLLKDVLAKSLAERNLRASTGMDAQIARMEIGLATPTVNMEGLKIYNPAGFGGGTLLDLPEMRLEYDADAAGKGKVRLKTLRVHLAEVNIVKDKNGVSNLDLLKQRTKQHKAGEKDKTNGPNENFTGIDTLYLTIDRVAIIDLANPQRNQMINVGLKDVVMQNMKTEEDIEARFLLAMLPVMVTNTAVRENLSPSIGDLFKTPKKSKRPRADTGAPAPVPAR